MKAWLKFIVATGLFVGICSGFYFSITRSVFRIHNIEITLDENKDPSFMFKDVKQSLDKKLQRLLGQYVWSVDLENILNFIETDRRVKDAKVTRILPNTIRVIIEPRSAIATILGNESHVLFPIAADGKILPAVEASEAIDNPILRGEIFLKSEDLRKKAIDFLSVLPEAGSLSRASISEIYFDKIKGISLTLKKSGTEVIIGNDDYKIRASEVSRVVHYLDSQQMVGRVIDARYSKKVVVKLRNEP